MRPAAANRRRGAPLIMLGLLMGVWVSGRAALWETPFPGGGLPLTGAEILLAERDEGKDFISVPRGPDRSVIALASILPAPDFQLHRSDLSSAAGRNLPTGTGPSVLNSIAMGSLVAAGHQFLMAAAFRVDWAAQTAPEIYTARQTARLRSGAADAEPLTASFMASGKSAERWSLDAFAYYRAGSGSTSISQGRAPVYGASQMAVNLQYRAAPTSSHDPHVYLRAYRAFVPDGENELAAGMSARPIGSVPVRLGAELRVTDNAFGTEARPAAYAVTVLPVASLPFDLRAEAYGSAGYVGGLADTAFADGQVAVTREIARFGGADKQSLRLSVGSAGWGGAQRDASRLDIGPTLRIDLNIADVPARLALDWRERVAGAAAPNSGIAATLSTRF